MDSQKNAEGLCFVNSNNTMAYHPSSNFSVVYPGPVFENSNEMNRTSACLPPDDSCSGGTAFGPGASASFSTSGRRTSRVWKYFRMANNNYYVCCLCNFVGAYTNTTNMRKHIQIHHPEIFQDILDHTRPTNRLNYFQLFPPPLSNPNNNTAASEYPSHNPSFNSIENFNDYDANATVVTSTNCTFEDVSNDDRGLPALIPQNNEKFQIKSEYPLSATLHLNSKNFVDFKCNNTRLSLKGRVNRCFWTSKIISCTVIYFLQLIPCSH